MFATWRAPQFRETRIYGIGQVLFLWPFGLAVLFESAFWALELSAAFSWASPPASNLQCQV